MNYLKREKALLSAISERYKDRPKNDKERLAEFDRVSDLIREMIGVRADMITGSLKLVINNPKDAGTIPEEPENRLYQYMNEINRICADYGVKPMFPDAGSDSTPKELRDVFQEYMDQTAACARLSRDALQEALKTGDFEEYDKIHDRLVEDIETAMKQDEEDSWVDPEEYMANDTAGGNNMNPWGMFEDDTDARDYLTNLNEKCKNKKAMFRDSVINQTLSCLIGQVKPNVLLIGAAGVGKTFIVEDIAGRLENKDPRIPDHLKGYTIWELQLSDIISGSGLVGDVERKLRAVLNFAKDPENKAILFIDEVHMIVSGMQSYDKIAQIMKPALSRGEIKVIGSTTLQEAQNFMNDPAFNRRFTRIIVDELSQDQTVELLKMEAKKLTDHYEGHVLVEDDLIKEIVKIADDYRTAGAHRPDNAITLLDRVMADSIVERSGKKKKDALKLDRDRIRDTAMRLMTGNNVRASVDIEELKKALATIKGQDKALEYLIDAINRDSLSVFPRKKPLTFLFAGSSGVGKTEVTKILAEAITGVKPIILNMTEFSSSADINKIVGSPVGYKGSDSNAELPFDILESNPYQVILLDEFEKSDTAVQRLFMSAFDEGYINTARGKMVDFSKSIIIATTNAGYSGEKKRIGFSFSDEEKETSVVELSKYYDVELLNRFTKILNFRPISRENFKEIMKDTYDREVKRIRLSGDAQYEILPKKLTEKEAERLTEENYNANFGARPVNRTVQKYIEDIILEKR